MKEKQIRLHLLSEFYKSARNGTEAPRIMNHPALKGIDNQEYNFNCYYLIEHGLLIGKNENTRAGVIAFPSRISGRGIDIIEKLIEESELSLKTKQLVLSDKAITLVEKLAELFIIWSKNPDLHKMAWEVLEKLITRQ